MDILYFKALILGLLEGLTEFLPISSTGHLIIAGDWLQFTDEKSNVFKIFIQLGAILSICWFYRLKIMQVIRQLPHDAAAQRFTSNLAIAFIPAALLGLLFHKVIKDLLFNPFNVAIALIIGGGIILVVERTVVAKPRIETVEEMRWTDALKVGVAQAFALIPGTSRSGATIIGGLIVGLSRQAATEFSFFLAIPTMFAATSYDLYKNWGLLNSGDLAVFAIGFVAAFVSAFAAVKTLLHYVAHHTFTAFAYYRIVFGLVVLGYFW